MSVHQWKDSVIICFYYFLFLSIFYYFLSLSVRKKRQRPQTAATVFCVSDRFALFSLTPSFYLNPVCSISFFSVTFIGALFETWRTLTALFESDLWSRYRCNWCSPEESQRSADDPGEDAIFVRGNSDDSLLAVRTCDTSRNVFELIPHGDDHCNWETPCKIHRQQLQQHPTRSGWGWADGSSVQVRLTRLSALRLLSRVDVNYRSSWGWGGDAWLQKLW